MESSVFSLGGADWPRIGLILAMGLVLWVLMGRVARLAGSRLLVGDIDTEHEKRAATLMRIVRQLLNTVLALVMTMLVLSEFGISITPLLGAAGVVGVALGLGAQTLAKDFIRGFSLLFDNQVRVGDRVQIAGNHGKVEAIDLRSVTLRDDDGAVHFIPASEIKIVTNRSFGHVYAMLELGLPAGSDVAQAQAIVARAAEELRAAPAYANAILGAVEAGGVDRWTQDTVYLKARMRTRPDHDRAVLREWRARTYSALRAAGIESQG